MVTRETSLRSKVIRLAHQKPELRAHLLPLLKTAKVFHSDKALQTYLTEHPGADKGNHSVDTKTPPPIPDAAKAKSKSTPPPIPEAAKKPKSTPPPIPEAAKKVKAEPPPIPKPEGKSLKTEEGMKEYVKNYMEYAKTHPPSPENEKFMAEIQKHIDKDFFKKKKTGATRSRLIRLAHSTPTHRSFVLSLLED